MFNDKTVLILGAGASRPYGFPTAGELRGMLLGQSVRVWDDLGLTHMEALKASTALEEDFVRCVAGEREALERFRQAFREAQRVSIDSFIAGRTDSPHLAHVARQMVSAVILHCERHAVLDGGWYQWLLEFLLEDGRDFRKGLLSIVTFNYDRSLEYYLLKAFKNAFGLDEAKAEQMLKRIEFVHVYGSVGAVYTGVTGGYPLGSTNAIFEVASGLGLVAPRTEPVNLLRARQLLAEANRIVILGFGFWRENLDALCGEVSINSPAWHGKTVFSSCYRLWRSKKIEADARFQKPKNHLPGGPAIHWGESSQDIFDFVTHWDLKA